MAPSRPPLVSFKWLFAAVALAALASAATYVLTRPNPTTVLLANGMVLRQELERNRLEGQRQRADLYGQLEAKERSNQALQEKVKQLTNDRAETQKALETLKSNASQRPIARPSPDPVNRTKTPPVALLPEIKGGFYDLSIQLPVPPETMGAGEGREDLTIVATSGWNTRVRQNGVVLSWSGSAPSWKMNLQRDGGGSSEIWDGLQSQSFSVPNTFALKSDTAYIWTISDASNSKRFRSFAFRTISESVEAELDRALKKARTDDERVDLLLGFGMYDKASERVESSETIQPVVKDYLRGQTAGLRETGWQARERQKAVAIDFLAITDSSLGENARLGAFGIFRKFSNFSCKGAERVSLH